MGEELAGGGGEAVVAVDGDELRRARTTGQARVRPHRRAAAHPAGARAARRRAARRAERGCRSRPDGLPTREPDHSPNPVVPANSSGGLSCDVRPRRFSLVNVPLLHATRIGLQLACPPPAERAQLVGVLRNGERDGEGTEVERLGAGVGQLERDRQHLVELERDVERQFGDVVDGAHGEAFALVCVRLGPEPGRPVTSAGAGPDQPGPAGVARSVLGHDRQRSHDVGRAANERARVSSSLSSSIPSAS